MARELWSSLVRASVYLSVLNLWLVLPPSSLHTVEVLGGRTPTYYNAQAHPSVSFWPPAPSYVFSMTSFSNIWPPAPLGDGGGAILAPDVPAVCCSTQMETTAVEPHH